MGGFGSGRPSSGRRTVEICPSLDVSCLQKAGSLTPGRHGSLRWTRGNADAGSIQFRAESHALVLDYRFRVGSEESQHVTESVPLVRVPCHLGGSRPYFLCPGLVDGVACRRRVAKLYAGDRYFLCRHCYRLDYASQREGDWDRALRRASKTLKRIGATRSDWPHRVARPPRMWRRTYGRLHAKAEIAQEQADMLFIVQANRLLGRDRTTSRRGFWR